MCLSYVNDLLFLSKEEANIHKWAILSCQSFVDLEEKDDAKGFLGVRIEQNESGLLEMKQGLFDCVIEALGLDVIIINWKATPAEAKALVKEID